MKFAARLKLDTVTLNQETETIANQIKVDVAPLIEELRAAHTNERKVTEWYNNEGVNWVARNVHAGQDFEWQTAAAEISQTQIEADDPKKDYGLLRSPLQIALNAKPEGTIRGWISARNKENIHHHNEWLKAEGGKIKANAAAALEEFKIEAAASEAGIAATLSHAHQFYTQVLAAVIAQDHAGFIAVLKSSSAENIPMSLKFKLLEADIAGARSSSFDAMVNGQFASLKQEAAFMQEVVGVLGDDKFALRFLSQSMENATDDAKKERFRSYLSGFAGTVIPVDKNTVINANSFSRVEYIDGALRLYDTKGDHALGWPMSKIDARSILNSFSVRPHMLGLGENTYLNTNLVAYVIGRAGTIDFYDSGSKKIRSYHGDQEKGAAALEAIAQRANFIQMDDTSFVNANAVAAVTLNKGVLKLYNTQGKVVCNLKGMSQEWGQRVLAAFAAKPEFAAVNSTHQVNTNSWAAIATRNEHGLRLSNGSSAELTLEDLFPSEVQAFLETFSQKPGVIKVADGLLLNANNFNAVSYDDTEVIRLYNSQGTAVYRYGMPSEQAKLVLAEIAKRPNMVAISDTTFVNSARSTITTDYVGTIKLHNGKGKDIMRWPANDEQRAKILEDFAKRPGQIRLSESVVINTNSWGAAIYNHGDLKLHNSSGTDLKTLSVKPDAYQAFRQAHRLAGQTSALKADFTGHTRALKTALRSGTDDSVTYNNDGEFLPLMATAFLIASSNTAHAANDHHITAEAGFTTGGGGDFGGAGASGDFPEVSAQEEVEEIANADADAQMADQTAAAESSGGAADSSPAACDAGGGGGGGGCEISSDIHADPMFASLIDGHLGKGRFKGNDFEMR